MQAIIELFDELFDRLKQLNYERIFVVSVVVLTLLGSLYVYLMDFLLADYLAQEPVAEPEMAARLAPIGRVVLAEAAVAAPAGHQVSQSALDGSAFPEADGSGVGVSADKASADPVPEALASGDPVSVAFPAEGAVPGERPMAAGSSEGAAKPVPAAEPESALAPVETAASEPESAPAPVETTASEPESGPAPVQPAASELAAPGVTAPNVIAGQPASTDGDRPATGAAPTPDSRAQAPGDGSAPVGFMPIPMPGQTYAPGYSPYRPQYGQQYPAPPIDPRQVPGATSWYGPYQPYAAPQYQRPGAPAPVYPAPPGWVR